MRLSRGLPKGQSAGSQPNLTGWSKRGEYHSKRPANGSRRRLAVGMLIVPLVLVLIGTRLGAAQKPENKAVYLVARHGLSDPFFAHSVVLMLPSTELPLVVGLIINRPTRIPLRQLFPQNPALNSKTQTAFFGGPVDVRDPSVAFRTSQPPKGAIHLVDDVYLSFDPHFIDTLLKNPQGTQDVRVFLGRSQWAPAQLQDEILQGAWYSVEAESKLIFDSDPQQVWHTLLDRARPANVVDYRVPAPATPTRLERLLIGPLRWKSL